MNQLFQNASIGTMRLRNRFVRSATAEARTDGTAVSDDLVEMYRALAKGGVGLITTGYAHISEKGQAIPAMLAMDSTAKTSDLQRLTAAVHGEGAAIVAQLVHAGPNRGFDPGFPAEAPSAVQDRATETVPVEMTEKDIQEMVGDFAAAAKRAKQGGFDGVQIHVAHGYLLSSFLSPYANIRTDKYGGSIENRARVVFEAYRAVRDAVGDDFTVTAKIDAKQYFDVGMNAEESAWVCRELSAMGIDAIELSAIGGPEFFGIFMNIDEPSKEAYLESFAKELKPSIKCPLILVGGLRSLDVIERLHSEGTADFFSMSRPLISEPDLVKRWESGDRTKARCISCTKCLFGLFEGVKVKCHHFEGDQAGA